MARMIGILPLFAFLSALLLFPVHTLAFGQLSTPQPDALYHDKHASLQGRMAADDHLEFSDEGAIPLVRIQQRHVGKRENHHEFFTPSGQIVLDWHFPDNRIRSFEYSHEDRSYVNLEQLQSHDIILDRRPICTKDNTALDRSILHIDFRYEDAYYNAKQQWAEPDLLFVIQDESCHVGPNTRSVYRSEEIVFNDHVLSIQIAAEDLSFGPYEAEAAHKVTITTGSFESLKKRHSAEPFYLTPRTNMSALRRLLKRQLDDPIPGLKNPIEEIPNKIDDPTEDLPDKIQKPIEDIPDKAGNKVEELNKNLEEAGSEWLHGMLEKLEDKLAFNFNKTVNIDFDANYNKTTLEAKNDRQKVNDPGDNPLVAALPKVTLIDSYASVHLAVTVVVTFGIKDAVKQLEDEDMGESLKKMFEDSLENMYVEVETTDDFHVQLQAEIVQSYGGSAFCQMFLFPEPGVWGCSVGPSKNKQLIQWDTTGSEKENPKYEYANMFGIDGLGISIAGGLAIWESTTVSGSMNITTPGVEIFVPKGSVAGYGRKNGHAYKSAFDGDVKWLKPKFHTQDLEFDQTLGIGPAMSISFGMAEQSGGTRKRLGSKGGVDSKGLQREPKGGDDGSREIVQTEQYRNQTDTHSLVSRAPFEPAAVIGLYARAELPSFEFKVFTKTGVDDKCELNGTFKDAFGVQIDLKVGFFAGVDLPGGLQVDTSWIKTGVKTMQGLKYVVHLWRKCWDISNTAFGKWESGVTQDIEDGLNKDRTNLAKAFYDHEGDRAGNNSSNSKPSPVGHQSGFNTTTSHKSRPTKYPGTMETSYRTQTRNTLSRSKLSAEISYKPSPPKYPGPSKLNSLPLLTILPSNTETAHHSGLTPHPLNGPSSLYHTTKATDKAQPSVSIPRSSKSLRPYPSAQKSQLPNLNPAPSPAKSPKPAATPDDTPAPTKQTPGPHCAQLLEDAIAIDQKAGPGPKPGEYALFGIGSCNGGYWGHPSDSTESPPLPTTAANLGASSRCEKFEGLGKRIWNVENFGPGIQTAHQSFFVALLGECTTGYIVPPARPTPHSPPM